MNKLTANQLIELVKGMTDVSPDLSDWDHEDLKYLNLSEEIYSSGFLIVFELDIKGHRIRGMSDFREEQEYHSPKFTKAITNIRVYNDDGEKLEMLDKHYNSIKFNLIKNIYPS